MNFLDAAGLARFFSGLGQKFAALSHTHGTADIEDGAITTAKLADMAVTTSKLGNKCVANGNLGDMSVQEGKIYPQAVTTTKIRDGAVTEDKLDAALAAKINAAGAGITDVTSIVGGPLINRSLRLVVQCSTTDSKVIEFDNILDTELADHGDIVGITWDGDSAGAPVITFADNSQLVMTFSQSIITTPQGGFASLDYSVSQTAKVTFPSGNEYSYPYTTFQPYRYEDVTFDEQTGGLTCCGAYDIVQETPTWGMFSVDYTFNEMQNGDQLTFATYSQGNVVIPYTPYWDIPSYGITSDMIANNAIGATKLSGTFDQLASGKTVSKNGTISISKAANTYKYILVWLDLETAEDGTSQKYAGSYMYGCVAPTSTSATVRLRGDRFIHPHDNGGTINGFGWLHFELEIKNKTVTVTKASLTYIDPNFNPWSFTTSDVQLRVSKIAGVK